MLRRAGGNCSSCLEEAALEMSNTTQAENTSSNACYLHTNCFTFLSGRQVLSPQQLKTAGIFSSTLIPLVIVANLVLLLHLKKRPNVPGNFRRLLQVLCITDLFVGGIALPTFAFCLLIYPSSCQCALELIAQFSAAMFGGSSGRTTVLIAFEQSIHVKSIITHPFIETRLYKVLISSAGPAISLLVAISVTVGSNRNLYPQISGAFIILDVATLVAVIFLYVSAYCSVHQHTISTKLRMSRKFNYNRIFAKKVTRIICVLVVCYGPFILTNLLLSFSSQLLPISTLRLVNIWSYNIVYVNSFLNALVFLCKDGVLGKEPRLTNAKLGLRVVKEAPKQVAFQNRIVQSLSIDQNE